MTVSTNPDRPGRRCVFFDRDGVVNVSPGEGYVTSWEAFHFSDGIFDALAETRAHDALAILVTSQRCVAKQLITSKDLDDLHSKMQIELTRRAGTCFDAIFAFDGLPATASWEKPNPDMILLAKEQLQIDLERSLMIGDADRDIEMGRRAGVATTIRVLGEKPVGVEADHTVSAVGELASLLRELLAN